MNWWSYVILIVAVRFFRHTVCMSIFCMFLLLFYLYLSGVCISCFAMYFYYGWPACSYGSLPLYCWIIFILHCRGLLCSWQINKMWCDNSDVAPNQWIFLHCGQGWHTFVDYRPKIHHFKKVVIVWRPTARIAPWWLCRCWSAAAYSSGRCLFISQLAWGRSSHCHLLTCWIALAVQLCTLIQ